MTKISNIHSEKQFTNELISYVFISLTAVLLAFNYQLFIVINHFAPAGINGIATMVQYKTGFSIAYMALVINIPLCVFAYFFINKDFAKKSLCFCLVYSGVYRYLQKLGLEAFQYNANGHDTVFPVIISGIISGLVYGICVRLNSSTGGTDIISKYISRQRPNLNFFWITFSLNAVVAVASFFVYAQAGEEGTVIYDYKPVCLCMLYCFISSFVGNYIIRGTKSAYKFTIITSHADEINKEIIYTLKHSSTQLAGTGTYSHNSRDVIICIVNKHQVADFQAILRKYDDTFSFSEMVNETYGNFVRVKYNG